MTQAKDLLTYSTIQLFTPLGGLYEVLVNSVALGPCVVTIKTTGAPGQDDEYEGPTLVVTPDTMITVIKEPDLTPYGRVQQFAKVWSRRVEDAHGDAEWYAAGEMLDALITLLPDLKA